MTGKGPSQDQGDPRPHELVLSQVLEVQKETDGNDAPWVTWKERLLVNHFHQMSLPPVTASVGVWDLFLMVPAA